MCNNLQLWPENLWQDSQKGPQSQEEQSVKSIHASVVVREWMEERTNVISVGMLAVLRSRNGVGSRSHENRLRPKRMC